MLCFEAYVYNVLYSRMHGSECSFDYRVIAQSSSHAYDEEGEAWQPPQRTFERPGKEAVIKWAALTRKREPACWCSVDMEYFFLPHLSKWGTRDHRMVQAHTAYVIKHHDVPDIHTITAHAVFTGSQERHLQVGAWRSVVSFLENKYCMDLIGKMWHPCNGSAILPSVVWLHIPSPDKHIFWKGTVSHYFPERYSFSLSSFIA